MDFYIKLVGSSDDTTHEYHQLRHEEYDQVDMRFGNKSFVNEGDVLLLYAINTSRIRYLYGYAIVIGGSKDYSPTRHPKWKWSRGILPVKVVSDLNNSLKHDLDNPLKSEVFPLSSGKGANITQGVGGCIKLKDPEDGIGLFRKVISLPASHFRELNIENVIEKMNKSHPITSRMLKETQDEWIRYVENIESKFK